MQRPKNSTLRVLFAVFMACEITFQQRFVSVTAGGSHPAWNSAMECLDSVQRLPRMVSHHILVHEAALYVRACRRNPPHGDLAIRLRQG
jgi:hypothetical protein